MCIPTQSELYHRIITSFYTSPGQYAIQRVYGSSIKNPLLNRALKRLYFTTSHYKTRQYSKVDSQTSFSADLILMVSLFACPFSCNWPTNGETFVSKRLCPGMISTFPSDLLLPSLMVQPVKSASRSTISLQVQIHLAFPAIMCVDQLHSRGNTNNS